MKTKYILIAETEQITHCSLIYIVAVGRSVKDQAALMCLEQLAAARGYFLAKYTEESRLFLMRIGESLALPVMLMNIQHYDIVSLISYIRRQRKLPAAAQEQTRREKLFQYLTPGFRD